MLVHPSGAAAIVSSGSAAMRSGPSLPRTMTSTTCGPVIDPPGVEVGVAALRRPASHCEASPLARPSPLWDDSPELRHLLAREAAHDRYPSDPSARRRQARAEEATRCGPRRATLPGRR